MSAAPIARAETLAPPSEEVVRSALCAARLAGAPWRDRRLALSQFERQARLSALLPRISVALSRDAGVRFLVDDTSGSATGIRQADGLRIEVRASFDLDRLLWSSDLLSLRREAHDLFAKAADEERETIRLVTEARRLSAAPLGIEEEPATRQTNLEATTAALRHKTGGEFEKACRGRAETSP